MKTVVAGSCRLRMSLGEKMSDDVGWPRPQVRSVMVRMKRDAALLVKFFPSSFRVEMWQILRLESRNGWR